jgi:hypothetical protein
MGTEVTTVMNHRPPVIAILAGTEPTPGVPRMCQDGQNRSDMANAAVQTKRCELDKIARCGPGDTGGTPGIGIYTPAVGGSKPSAPKFQIAC